MEETNPWANGHSISVLRTVAAGIVATVQGFRVEPLTVNGVTAEWVVADGVTPDAPVALYFHGGAYLCGTLEQYRNVTVGLSRAAQVRVLAVDYRLAPEHPHPAAFEDGVAAYRWLLKQPGIESKSLLVAGDSAGASLAISVVMDAIELGLPSPSCIWTNSPFADLALQSASLDSPELNANEPNKTTIAWLAHTYLDAAQLNGAPRLSAQDPRHSPVYRDLHGLPPLLVQTGGLDNLQDDGIRLAAQATGCGVSTQHTHYPNAPHIWVVLALPQEDKVVAKAFLELAEFCAIHLQY